MPALIGSHWTAEPLEPVPFDCPHCGDATRGVAWRQRRWVAVLARPLMSLGPGARYIRCERCGRTYDELLLRAQPPASAAPPANHTDVGVGHAERGADRGADRGGDQVMSEDERAILSVVAAVIFSDSAIRRSEKMAARTVIRRFTRRELDAAGLNALLRTARQRWGDPLGLLRRLAGLLDEAAKRRIVAAAYLVSASDRELHPEETRLLMRMGEALKMTPSSVMRAMREARDGRGAEGATDEEPENEG